MTLDLQVGIRQGFLGGLVVGITNCAAFCAYALALWYGSTRIVAGSYTGGCCFVVRLAHWCWHVEQAEAWHQHCSSVPAALAHLMQAHRIDEAQICKTPAA